MVITATELKSNLGLYLEASQNDEIIITRNGRRFAKLVGEQQAKVETFASLRGILPNNSNLAEIKESRMKAHENHI
ncbi:MAG: type II toxin-antitoxin system Phd/YefM family antitoxin [Coriobacteriia bacterium]|nr:type II toxin-antitoxin system Phd/YefM family antitoxin [Coriobacteriia bacterium]